MYADYFNPQASAYTAVMHLEDTAELCINAHACRITANMYSSAMLLIS